MTIADFIKTTRVLPNKARTDSGIEVELMVRKRFAGGYIAALRSVNPDQMLQYAIADTAEQAKEALKNKIIASNPNPS